MFNVYCLFFYKEKELFTGGGCVGVVISWQLCRTIGPVLSQRFPLASAKAQPRGDFCYSYTLNETMQVYYIAYHKC